MALTDKKRTTEDVVYMFESMGVATGMDLFKLIEVAKRLEILPEHPLPGQLMKSGADGF